MKETRRSYATVPLPTVPSTILQSGFTTSKIPASLDRLNENILNQEVVLSQEVVRWKPGHAVWWILFKWAFGGVKWTIIMGWKKNLAIQTKTIIFRTQPHPLIPKKMLTNKIAVLKVSKKWCKSTCVLVMDGNCFFKHVSPIPFYDAYVPLIPWAIFRMFQDEHVPR